MVTVEAMKENVERGAALLDIKCPDWVDRIDVDRLDILSGTNCVLGQTFGNYVTGLYFLFGHGTLGGYALYASDYGFMVTSNTCLSSSVLKQNETLKFFWREEIEKRLVDSEFNNIVERNEEDMKWDPTVYSVPYWGGQFPGSDIDTDTNGVVPTYDYQNPELFVSFSQGNNAPAQPKGINTYQLADESKFTKNGSPPMAPVPV